MPGPLTNGVVVNGNSHVNRLTPHDDVHFDQKLQPKRYHIKGTAADSQILFTDVNILDSTGQKPYPGDVLIEGQRFRHVGTVPNKAQLANDPGVTVIEGRGRTLMSGLGDAHTHFSWNNGDLGKLGGLGVEEHTLMTAQAAKTYIDSGYTMCFGAASAKEKLDVTIRDWINEGHIPGPRYLANGKEMAVPDGELVPGITAFASGPLEMRETIRHHIKLGVDTIKLSMSGEEITETRSAEDCYFTDEETAACVDEAHRHGVRLCAHARARDSVKMCLKHGVDIIYHASWIDAEGMDELERKRDQFIVAPGINWLYNTLYEAHNYGYSFEKAEQVGYKRELDAAIRGLSEMHRRGITVLPGGDYGFAWTPHGTYARDLEHFVNLLGFTEMESILSATAGVAKLFMREDELGKVLPGYLADCILVDGDPLKDIKILQQHDKLNVIMINGRLHKCGAAEHMRTLPTVNATQPRNVYTKFTCYEDVYGKPRVGHRSSDETITPLSFLSGTPVTSMYQVLEVGADGVMPSGEDWVSLSDVKILPPFAGRDVLAVGKNYSEHAKEFNKSGYDASDKVDIPTHPVIFTKRATSIIADGDEILPHEDFTQTLDYEGEIGVILGKTGFQISEQDANDYVWGYTIINDVTAREKQRDHKQFYIGKSADTFCPMGPIAVPKQHLPDELKVETRINGQLRQSGSIRDLIFSVPTLIKTLSESQTLRAGDVIATGTPAGVGFGLSPQQFLSAGDEVSISISGLGILRNRIATAPTKSSLTDRLSRLSTIPTDNLSHTNGGKDLKLLSNGKQVHVSTYGAGPRPLIFVHGLGGSTMNYRPLMQQLGLKESSTHTSMLYDLEGHGLSPSKATSQLSIASFADDLHALIEHHPISITTSNPVTLVAHSMGCLIAQTFALQHPELINRLILIGPPPSPLPDAANKAMVQRARGVRHGSGMRACASSVATAGTSALTKSDRPLALASVEQSLMSQDPEGYAKACTALGASAFDTIQSDQLKCEVLVVSSSEDKVAPLDFAEKLVGSVANRRLEVMQDVGHWYQLEDVAGTAKAIGRFL